MPSFFEEIPLLVDFLSIADRTRYRPLPDDWWVIITDIRGSTGAIERGRYKDVNSAGAATIISVINAVGGADLPFIFGGDGATLAVPQEHIEKVRPALAGSRSLALKEFGLELRVGLVPVRIIREAGYDISVARYRISENVTQAAFMGGGLTYAEQLVKDSAPNNSFLLPAQEVGDSDFSGLECRWKPVKNAHGEIISLVARALSKDVSQSEAVYTHLIYEISKIYDLKRGSAPIETSRLRLSFSLQGLLTEAKIRRNGKVTQGLYLIGIWLLNFLAAPVFKYGLKLFGYNWGKYRADVANNSDYRKFDDTLRMVLDGSPDQRKKLLQVLEKEKAEGRIVYGLHVSSEALLTCLVFNRHGNHLHFVDGSHGGYAAAAQQMKKQMSVSSEVIRAEK